MTAKINVFIDLEISPTSSVIFTGGSKSVKFGVILNIAWLWAAPVWKCSKISEYWNKLAKKWLSPYVLPRSVKFGPRTPENRPEKMPHP